MLQIGFLLILGISDPVGLLSRSRFYGALLGMVCMLYLLPLCWVLALLNSTLFLGNVEFFRGKPWRAWQRWAQLALKVGLGFPVSLSTAGHLFAVLSTRGQYHTRVIPWRALLDSTA